ncbi:alpha/beta-hydrolase, partial [Conidiobolus coronatus NRRL 28638]
AGLNNAQIVVGGDSAGGGFTANLIHFLRNNKRPQPSGTFMWSPSVDLTFSQPSMFDNNPKDILWKMNFPISLSSKGIELDSGFYWWIFNHSSSDLLARIKKDGTPFGPKEATLWPEVSPMFDQDNSYLPPTLIIVGERDSLRDPGVIYGINRGKSEIEGKVNKTIIPNIQTILYEDQVHAFMAFPFSKYSTWAVKSTGEFIYQALHQNNTHAIESKTYEYLPDYKKAYMSSTYNMYWKNVIGTSFPWNSTYRTIPYPTPEVFNLKTSAFIGGLGIV